MEIHDFLNKHLTHGQEFHGLIASVDIVGSRHLSGTDEEKQKTKEAIRNLIEGLLSNLSMAILGWRGDGGLLICDVRDGFADVIRICDLIVGLVPVINRSRNIYNFLPWDTIHLRVVCNYGLIRNTGDPETLTKNTIDDMFSEKQVGITDHVVVSHQVFDKIPPVFKDRFTQLPDHGTPLDPCYALDLNTSITELEIEETSEQLVNWIAEMVVRGNYDELLIFSYTSETIYQYLMLHLPKIKIRVLIRNWLVEGEEEHEYNQRTFPPSKTKTAAGILRRPWAKAQSIKAIAYQLMDNDRPISSTKVDIRFYKDKPLFRGAILLGPQDRRAAFIGMYSWLPKRKEGGSPYYGINPPSMLVTDDGCAKSAHIDVFASRFEELWATGLSYEQMVEMESRYDASHRVNIEKIFALNNKPYLVIYPGRTLEGRRLPLIAIEDFSASNAIRGMLESQGKDVSTEVVIGDTYPENVGKWEGHIICLCHRSWIPHEFPDVQLDASPYKLIADGQTPPHILLTDVNHSITSPIDADNPQDRDFALIIKRSRSNGSKIIFVAGLHAIGTWGAADFLTRTQTLGYLASQVQKNDFAVVIECEFSVPHRDMKTRILHGPRVIE